MTSAKILEVAQSYIGTMVGSEKHKRLLTIYNQVPLPRGYKVTEQDDWCAIFVSAVSIEAGCGELIPKECSCQKMLDLFNKIGRYKKVALDYKPTPGDIIFYSNRKSGYSNHIGIVKSIENKTITVIEGNTKSRVDCRFIPYDFDYIVGYGVPAYIDNINDFTDNSVELNKIADHYKHHAVVVDEVRHGNWGHGETRKKLLREAGYNPIIVQALVNLLEL